MTPYGAELAPVVPWGPVITALALGIVAGAGVRLARWFLRV